MPRFVCTCLLLALAGAARADDGLAPRAAAALFDGVRTAELGNGLRVYLKPVAGSPARAPCSRSSSIQASTAPGTAAASAPAPAAR